MNGNTSYSNGTMAEEKKEKYMEEVKKEKSLNQYVCCVLWWRDRRLPRCNPLSFLVSTC